MTGPLPDDRERAGEGAAARIPTRYWLAAMRYRFRASDRRPIVAASTHFAARRVDAERQPRQFAELERVVVNDRVVEGILWAPTARPFFEKQREYPQADSNR
ncbi:MAG: hypothetical protein ABSC46_10630 [Candidatus Limnocylindrales bacterium]